MLGAPIVILVRGHLDVPSYAFLWCVRSLLLAGPLGGNPNPILNGNMDFSRNPGRDSIPFRILRQCLASKEALHRP